MKETDIIQIQNEIFTKLVIDLLRQQRTDGRKPGEYLLDKYMVDAEVKERLKKILSEERR